jgi:hypothetical protein
MKKVIKLTESELTTLVKNVIKENQLTALVKRVIREVAEEPIMDPKEKIYGTVYFDEGKTFPSYDSSGQPFNKEDYNDTIEELADFLSKETNTIKTIEKFYDNPTFKIPKFISVNVGTSHSGTGEKNASVAQGRLDFLTGIVMKAFNKIGLDASVAKSFIVSNTNAQYKPTKLNPIYEPKKVRTSQFDRFGFISVTPINVKGNTTAGIQKIQTGLNSASSIINSIFLPVDGVNEIKVLNYIKGLQTFSDIQDLSNSIKAGGKWDSLEDFLNDQLFDDPKEMLEINTHLQKCAVNSGKQKNTVRLSSTTRGYEISIGLDN